MSREEALMRVSPNLRAALEEAWISLARRPKALRGGADVEFLPPRLWERLRLDLQEEFRRATGEPTAILTFEIHYDR